MFWHIIADVLVHHSRCFCTSESDFQGAFWGFYYVNARGEVSAVQLLAGEVVDLGTLRGYYVVALYAYCPLLLVGDLCHSGAASVEVFEAVKVYWGLIGGVI